MWCTPANASRCSAARRERAALGDHLAQRLAQGGEALLAEGVGPRALQPARRRVRRGLERAPALGEADDARAAVLRVDMALDVPAAFELLPRARGPLRDRGRRRGPPPAARRSPEHRARRAALPAQRRRRLGEAALIKTSPGARHLRFFEALGAPLAPGADPTPLTAPPAYDSYVAIGRACGMDFVAPGA